MFRTLDEIGTGRRVLVRLDLNSPVEDGAVRDNRRFARHAETIRELADGDHRVVCIAHQGRPGRETFVSLEAHADILAEHVGRRVGFVPDTHGERALSAIRALDAGEVLLLENVRMTEGELPERPPTEHAEADLVTALSGAVDCYVDDAYSAAHRSHASLVGFPRHLPAYAGRVMEAEYRANTAIATNEFDGPVTMVLGGTKVPDIVSVMQSLDDRVDQFLLGGVPGELFLRATGRPVGRDAGGADHLEEQWAATHETVEALLAERGDRIHLPVDLAREADGERVEVAVDQIEAKESAYLDVGARTVEEFGAAIRDSAAVFVKGSPGRFEDRRFARGTVGLLETIAEADCFSVIGGGDTSRAIGLYDLDEAAYSHVSIAGGAYIRALTGEPLPGVEALCEE